MKVISVAFDKVEQDYRVENSANGRVMFYHNLVHTKNVVSSARKIAERAIENGTIEDNAGVLAEIAAAFHDVEQRRGSGVNEEESVRLAQNEMTKENVFSSRDAEKVKNMILATIVSFAGGNMKQSATDDYLTKILADADLSSLGQPPEVYWASAQSLLKEIKNTDAPTLKDQLDWARGQIIFLSNHEFYTDEAKELFPHKEENIEFAKEQVRKLEAEFAKMN